MKTLAYAKPIGAKHEFSRAEIAVPVNTTDLVDHQASDASFFRKLEQQGILLDSEQLEAVRAIHEPTLVAAGAGSGKTRVLTSRVCYILDTVKVSPTQIMLVTFTTKAASEMQERLSQMLPQEVVEKMMIGTFHSILLRMLRKQGVKAIIVGSDAYRRTIVSRIARKLKCENLLAPETILSAISGYKNQMLMPGDITISNALEAKLVACYEEYEDWLNTNNSMDFDDVLIKAVVFLENNLEYRHFMQQHFKYISVDEFQDSNLLQNRIIELITTPTSNVFFVGDPKQAIYGFRHSSTSYLEDLHELYPSLKRYYLTTNYRSNDLIVGASNDVIMHLDRASKVIREAEKGLYFIRPKDVHEEAKMIVDTIVDQCATGRSFNEFAILYRINVYSRAVLEELIHRNIPIQIHNAELFYEKTTIKQLLAYLRIAVNPLDLSAIADLAPTLYINRDTAYEHLLIALSDDLNGIQALKELASDYKLREIEKRSMIIEKIATLSPKSAIQKIRKQFFDKFLKSEADQTIHQDMINDILDELETSAQRFATISEFITFVEDFITQCNNQHEAEDAVNLMTIHQSKGLEFPTVFLIGVCERILPHHTANNTDDKPDQVLKGFEAILEENRILYVGMTRAKDELFVSSPKVYHGKIAKVSRFLTSKDSIVG